jgi:DNA-directed RNA polymerase specialized sigma subunit
MKESLTQKEYATVYGIHFEGKNAIQLANERGVSHQNISEQNRRALKKLSQNQTLKELYKTYVL